MKLLKYHLTGRRYIGVVVIILRDKGHSASSAQKVVLVFNLQQIWHAVNIRRVRKLEVVGRVIELLLLAVLIAALSAYLAIGDDRDKHI